ncbi:MAG: hypothetical protein J5940_05745 [Clostridia bacterium]|nr:hypothetical protein [Clostridia bacterium]
MNGGIADKLRKKRGWILIAAGAVLGVALIILGTVSGGRTETPSEAASDAYVSGIENKIRQMTELVTGSSDVEVAIFVSSSREYVYASDADGGRSGYAALQSSDGRSGLVLIKEVYPKIESVAVVCRGGDGAAVQAKLIKLISAATGLSSNRISIAGSK